MKKLLFKGAMLLIALTLTLSALLSCGGSEENSGAEYSVTVGGVTVKPDMDMAEILPAITETYKYSESSACPPFEGTEKLYDFTSIKITTYSKDGKDLVMGIFLKDESLNISGVSIGSSFEDMKTKLGENYAEAGVGNYVYTAKDGAKLKCVVKNGSVVLLQLITKAADS